MPKMKLADKDGKPLLQFITIGRVNIDTEIYERWAFRDDGNIIRAIKWTKVDGGSKVYDEGEYEWFDKIPLEDVDTFDFFAYVKERNRTVTKYRETQKERKWHTLVESPTAKAKRERREAREQEEASSK